MVEQDSAEEGTSRLGSSCLGLREAWARDHHRNHPRTLIPEAGDGCRAGVAAGAERTAGGSNAGVKEEEEYASALTEGRTTAGVGNQRVQQAGIEADAVLSFQPSWLCGSEW